MAPRKSRSRSPPKSFKHYNRPRRQASSSNPNIKVNVNSVETRAEHSNSNRVTDFTIRINMSFMGSPLMLNSTPGNSGSSSGIPQVPGEEHRSRRSVTPHPSSTRKSRRRRLAGKKGESHTYQRKSRKSGQRDKSEAVEPEKEEDEESAGSSGQNAKPENSLDYDIVSLPYCSHVCNGSKCQIIKPTRRSARKTKSGKKPRSKSRAGYKRVSRSHGQGRSSNNNNNSNRRK